MHRPLTDVRARKAAGDKGFTLIELLVVVVILGVLIAIAIPVYLNYRKGANDSASESDVRNAVSVLEVCNVSVGNYPKLTTAGALVPCSGQNVTTSAGTTLTYISDANGKTYTLLGTNSGGVPKVWCYNNSKGGSVKDIVTVPATVTLNAC